MKKKIIIPELSLVITCLEKRDVTQHVYVHSIALCAPGGLSAGIPLVLVSAQFLSYLPGDNQGARGLLPTVCACSFFSVCRI